MMKLREIKQLISALPPRELAKLETWLHALLEDRRSKKGGGGTTKRHEVLPSHRATRKTYRLEFVRCGKASCHCAEGKLHGPYWYAYWSGGGKTRSQYIGKRLPKGIKIARGVSARRVR
jgi:hypothetical protein